MSHILETTKKRNLKGILKMSPQDKGCSPNKASKISVLLGYEEGTIHKTKNGLYHPCINHDDFVKKYEDILISIEDKWVKYDNGVYTIFFN